MRAHDWTGLRIIFIAAGLLALAAAGAQPVTVLPEHYLALKSVGSPEISPDGRWVVYTLRAWDPDPDPLGPQNKDKNKEKEENADIAPAEKQTQPEEQEKEGKEDAKKKKYKPQSHLWLIPADATSGVEPRQLTFGAKGEGNPQWSPDGKFISFVTSRSQGGEAKEARTQIWLLPMAGGEPYAITEAKEGVGGYGWSPDGKQIAFQSMDALPKAEKQKREAGDDPQVFEEDFRHMHLWTVEVSTKKASQITSGEDYTVTSAPNWSPDGHRLAFTAKYTTLLRDPRSDAYIVDVATKTARKIIDTTTVRSTPQWSPDGKTLALTMLPRHERSTKEFPDWGIYQARLYLYDIAAGTLKDVSSPDFDQAVSLLEKAWSRDGRRLLLTSGNGVYTDVYAYEISGGRYSRLTRQSLINGASFSADRGRVVYVSETPTTPADLYLARGDFSSPRRLSHTNPQVQNWALGQTEVIQWESTDGWQVEGILVRPAGYQEGRRYPLLVDVHGGPTGAHTNGFKRDAHFWAGQGWAVLYPNPRGSTNYGEKFMRGNIPDWGGGDYRDIMTGVDALIGRGIADEDKLAVMGWSYGGYMTAWIVSQTGRFKAAMMGAGLSNNRSMYGTTDISGYLGSFFGGYPNEETSPLFRERSGLTYADDITTPLLILHGENDKRVPLAQALEYYRALKVRDKPVRLVVYPRAGHGLSEYYHQLDRAWRQYRWMAGYTLGDGPLPEASVD